MQLHCRNTFGAEVHTLCFPSDSTHTHTHTYPSMFCRWCSQSKSMCVSVAVVAGVEQWELANWGQQMGCFFSVLWDHRVSCPPHCSRWPKRAVSLSEEEQSETIHSLSDTDGKGTVTVLQVLHKLSFTNNVKQWTDHFIFPKVMHFKTKQNTQNGPFKIFFFFLTSYPLLINLIQKSSFKKHHGIIMITQWGL